MSFPTLPQLAREQATFARYEDGELWYRIYWIGEDGVHPFEFPIPTDAPDLFAEVDAVLLDLAYLEHEDARRAKSNIIASLEAQQKRGAGGGQFLPEDRAVRFLRWIRPHLEYLKAAKQASAVNGGQ